MVSNILPTDAIPTPPVHRCGESLRAQQAQVHETIQQRTMLLGSGMEMGVPQ